MGTVYLDNAATTPPFPEVVEAMLPFIKENFGNPSSFHSYGVYSKREVEKARRKVANLIHANSEEIIFTSSGAEANNLALKGIALAYQKKGNHIIISEIEHYSVLHSAKTLEKMGFEITYIPVDKYGTVNPDDVLKAIRKETILISIMHANHEVGTIEPIAEIGKIAKEKEVLFHTDAIQSVGHIPVNVEEMGVDMLSLSGHRFYGPKGIGALYLKKGIRINPIIHGGIQEEGRRGGTENVPAIIGLGVAAEMVQKDLLGTGERVRKMRDRLEKGILERINHVYVNGHPTHRLSGFLSLCVEFVEGESMIMMLNAQGICAATGSACTSMAMKASHVLAAMGVNGALAQGSLLFSLGRGNVEEDVDRMLEILPPIVERLRQISPLYHESVNT